MIEIIRSKDRYHFETDWLSTYWHFSFDHYYDPANVQFGPLRVFNDDVIRAGGGFPLHGHKEMEIVTYVIEGELEHRDSMGNVGRIGPGEVQRMSAGTGVRHSEYNASKEKPLRLVQLWVLPAVMGLEPSWEQKKFTREERAGKLLPVAVPAESGSANGAVKIHQDATIYASVLRPGDSVAHTLGRGRRAYLFVVSGDVELNGQKLSGGPERLGAGDQARITDESKLALTGKSDAELLLLDLP
jgi:hypothetical protein